VFHIKGLKVVLTSFAKGSEPGTIGKLFHFNGLQRLRKRNEGSLKSVSNQRVEPGFDDK
jgi:hypothetical protein